MITSAAIGWAIAGLLALIAGATRQYLAYRHGRKVEQNKNKDAVLEKTLEMHKVREAIQTRPAPNSFDDLVDRL